MLRNQREQHQNMHAAKFDNELNIKSLGESDARLRKRLPLQKAGSAECFSPPEPVLSSPIDVFAMAHLTVSSVC